MKFKTVKIIMSATNRIKKILDAKYENTNLKEITNKLKYLHSDKLLKKHENIFDGTLWNYTGTEYKIELLEAAQPYHANSICHRQV